MEVPDLKNYSNIKTKFVDGKKPKEEKYQGYRRDDRLVRPWAIPGTPGYEHRIGGLEKAENTGNVSYDPENHEKMVHLRQEKVERVADNIPLQELEGEKTGDLLVVSWGGTYGATHTAVKQLQKEGKKVSLMHLRYINPMPKNVAELLKGFKKIVVAELNLGQMRNLLNYRYECHALGYNKIQGLPFKISELVSHFKKLLEG